MESNFQLDDILHSLNTQEFNDPRLKEILKKLYSKFNSLNVEEKVQEVFSPPPPSRRGTQPTPSATLAARAPSRHRRAHDPRRAGTSPEPETLDRARWWAHPTRAAGDAP